MQLGASIRNQQGIVLSTMSNVREASRSILIPTEEDDCISAHIHIYLKLKFDKNKPFLCSHYL